MRGYAWIVVILVDNDVVVRKEKRVLRVAGLCGVEPEEVLRNGSGDLFIERVVLGKIDDERRGTDFVSTAYLTQIWPNRLLFR